jgi:YD repeat-containing protein
MNGVINVESFLLNVWPQNEPPVVSSTPKTDLAQGELFHYQLQVNDPDGSNNLQISLDTASIENGLTVDDVGLVSWDTTAVPVGTYSVTISITDERGGVTVQTFDLMITADTTDPVVKIQTSTSQFQINRDFSAHVSATDNVGVVSRTLTITGYRVNSEPTILNTSVTLNSQDIGHLKFDVVGYYELTATATDSAGNVSTFVTEIFVGDPADVSPPTATINTITNGSVIDKPTDIYISVTDDDVLVLSYQVILVNLDTGVERVLFTGDEELTNQKVGTIDTTQLVDGSYQLVLIAVDAGNNRTVAIREFEVQSNFKLGNLKVSFDDIQAIIATLPITITRTYDSLNSESSQDFGYGWTVDYKVASLDIYYSEEYGTSSFSSYKPMRYGDRVVITLPDGTKQGFTFAPEPGKQVLGIVYYWIPKFVADAGVTSTLEVDPVELTRVGDEFISQDFVDGYYEYSPLDPMFGSGQFRLATQDKNQFVFDGNSKQLLSLTDSLNRKFRFTDNGIFDDSGDSLTFTRDYDGRITEITSSDGQHVSYEYDDEGDLVAVIGVDGQTTRFTYHDDVAHRLDTIIDPLGRPAARTEFDSTGRISRMIDADGKVISYEYGLETQTHTVKNQLGFVSQVTLDEWGNPLREVSAEGVITIRTYQHKRYGNSSKDLVLSETLVVGEQDTLENGQHDDLTTRYQYDAAGNQTAVIDPRGHATFTSYNRYAQPMVIQDILGNSTVYAYDTRALISSTIDSSGNQTFFQYNDKGQLTFVFNEQVLLQNVYNAQGQLIHSITPTSEVYYAYDRRGNVVLTWSPSVDAAGQPIDVVTRTIYNSQNLVEQTIRAIYPANDRLNTNFFEDIAEFVVIDPDYIQSTTSSTYDAVGQTLTTTNENGLVTEFTYDRRGLQIQTRSQAYDADGELVWLVSRTAYDAAGQVIASTETYLEGTTDPVHGSLNTYDADGHVIRTTEVTGLVIDLFNLAGDSITGSSIARTDAAKLSTRVVTAGTVLRTSSTTYDSSGRVTATTDSQSFVTRYIYNQFGEVVETRRETRNELGQAVYLVNRTVYDDYGRVSVTLDEYLSSRATTDEDLISPAGISGTRSTYDRLGRVVKTERLANVVVTLSTPANVTAGIYASALTTAGTVTWTSQTIYNLKGQVTSTIAADGQVTSYEYDNLGRQVAVILQAVVINGVSQSLRTETVYEDLGRVSARRTNIAQFADGTLDRSEQQVTSYLYDSAGNVVETTLPDESTISATYDIHGRKLTETNQLGQIRSYEYNAQGQLIAVTLPEVTLPDTTTASPRYEYAYDVWGNQVSLIDPLGHETHWVYNERGQLLSRTLPEGEIETFTYDSLGRQVLHVSFEGVVSENVYDPVTGDLSVQRLFTSLSSYEAHDNPAQRVQWVRDAYGRVVTTYTANAGESARVDQQVYDQEGQLAETRSPEGVLKYSYDALGRRTATRVYATNGTTLLSEAVTTYDGLGRVASITNTKGTTTTADDEATSYQYDHVGNLDLQTGPDGTITDYIYDELHRLDDMIIYQGDSTPETLADNDKLAEFDYTVQADGNRTGLTETFYDVTPVTNTYSWEYDALGRLVEEVMDMGDNALDQTTRYEFDLTGNRLKRELDKGNDSDTDETEVSEYDDNDRLLETVKSDETEVIEETTYTYTGTQQTGKVVETSTSTETTVYSYNLQGQMSSVAITKDSVTKTTSYTYDSQGFRVKVTTAEGTTEYLVDRNNDTGYPQAIREVHKNTGGTITKTVDYVFGLDEIS